MQLFQGWKTIKTTCLAYDFWWVVFISGIRKGRRTRKPLLVRSISYVKLISYAKLSTYAKLSPTMKTNILIFWAKKQKSKYTTDIRYRLKPKIGYFALKVWPKKTHNLSSIHLNCDVAPVDDSPLASVLHSANDALQCFQIDRLFNAEFFITRDPIP